MVFTPYPDLLIIYNSQDLSLSQRLVFAKQVIKDHDLKFGGTIKFIYGFGELEGKMDNKWKEIYERNDATPEYYLNLVFI